MKLDVEKRGSTFFKLEVKLDRTKLIGDYSIGVSIFRGETILLFMIGLDTDEYSAGIWRFYLCADTSFLSL